MSDNAAINSTHPSAINTNKRAVDIPVAEEGTSIHDLVICTIIFMHIHARNFYHRNISGRLQGLDGPEYTFTELIPSLGRRMHWITGIISNQLSELPGRPGGA
jgi:hypothetical protein